MIKKEQIDFRSVWSIWDQKADQHDNHMNRPANTIDSKDIPIDFLTLRF
jgi:hypothetical protein